MSMTHNSLSIRRLWLWHTTHCLYQKTKTMTHNSLSTRRLWVSHTAHCLSEDYEYGTQLTVYQKTMSMAHSSLSIRRLSHTGSEDHDNDTPLTVYHSNLRLERGSLQHRPHDHREVLLELFPQDLAHSRPRRDHVGYLKHPPTDNDMQTCQSLNRGESSILDHWEE